MLTLHAIAKYMLGIFSLSRALLLAPSPPPPHPCPYLTLMKTTFNINFIFSFLTSKANEDFLCLAESAGQLAKEFFRDLAPS
jgi:hypothetical protein